MPFIMVDIESDGPIPGDYSMISLGAVVVEDGLTRRFKALFRPQSAKWVPEALAVSGYTRAQTMAFPPVTVGLRDFATWVKSVGGDRPMFISDNNGFDWMFICWYFHHFMGSCPFGYSSTNLGSLYKGMVGDMKKNFKHLRQTKHTHDPVDDAVGNAEALLAMRGMGLKLQ